MSEGTRKNKVLVTGNPGVGKVELVKRILSKTRNPPSIPNTQNASLQQPLVLSCTLDTKYYTAEIGFWVDSAKGVQETDLEEWKQLGNSVDGFIYVFDRNKPETFTDLRAWASFLSHVEPNVALCIANGPTPDHHSSSASVSGSIDEWEDWCVSNGVEFIDIMQSAADQTTSDDMLGEEQVGFDRIVEALESNMWDGLRRKQNPNRQREVIGNDEDEDHDAAEEHHDLFDDINDLPDSEAVRQTHEQIFGRGTDDDEADGFERSLNALRGLREYGQNLPDIERRALAARVALSFGLELGDDSDEDGK
ncbi:hypothetical protein HDV00_000043 [Rhizophlyctis rosea]|nr:hypothetical protein HDV00_000043 [Rhizophlyctis rosea]